VQVAVLVNKDANAAHVSEHEFLYLDNNVIPVVRCEQRFGAVEPACAVS
jgi:hypothetical protein